MCRCFRWLVLCGLLLSGCDQPVQDSPPPVVLPDFDRDDAPEPGQLLSPTEEPEPPAPSLAERARDVFPSRPSTTLGEVEVDGIIVRATECCLVGGGCTLKLLMLSLDEDRVTGVDPATNLDGTLEPSVVFTSDMNLRGRLDIANTPILLPANVPVPLTIFWDGALSKPQNINLRFHHSAETVSLGGYRAYAATPDWDNWPRMEPGDIESALSLIACCDMSSPGTVHWGAGGYGGSVGVEFHGMPTGSGAFSGEFFVLDESGAKRSKSFQGRLDRADQAGEVLCTIETTRASGSPGRPSPEITNETLLMRGSSATINLRLYGHQFLGGTEDGVQFYVNAAPYIEDAPSADAGAEQ